ncbi:MAG: hypothetical protein AAF483_08435 [Planctomycetota bacterium]
MPHFEIADFHLSRTKPIVLIAFQTDRISALGLPQIESLTGLQNVAILLAGVATFCSHACFGVVQHQAATIGSE